MAGAGTGTQATAGTGTVQDILDILQYRHDIQVTTDDLIHIVNLAIRVIAKHLYARQSGLVTGQLSVAIVAATEDAYGDLPADFWGLKGDPYISGKTYTLYPLPSQAVALQYTGTGEPIYYKIQGLKIYVIPETSANCTIMGDYFQKPTAVTASTSAIPWNEIFNELIAEYVMSFFREPQKNAPMIDKTLRDGVDIIVQKYDRKGPVNFPQAVNWEV